MNNYFFNPLNEFYLFIIASATNNISISITKIIPYILPRPTHKSLIETKIDFEHNYQC